MTLIPRLEEKNCFIACSEDKVKQGLCNCVNRMQNQALNIPDVVKSFYCQKPTDYKASLKCKTQCGLCATFEGKRQ